MILPTFPQDSADPPSAARLGEICREAEALGARAFWATDHLFWHTPLMECLTALTVAALATERASVGSCVLQLPLRHAPAVAKQAASLQELSGGRLLLGVGVGSHEGEYDAAGVPFHGRGALLDAGIDQLHAAWASADAEHYRQLPPVGTVPVWVGGSSEAALRRAARHAEGWIPLFLTPEQYAAAMDRLDKEADRAGRDPAGVTRAMTCFVSVGDEATNQAGLDWMGSMYGLPAKAFARHLVAGDAPTVAAALEEWREAGAEHIAVYFTSDDPLVQFRQLAAELGGSFPPPGPDRSTGSGTGTTVVGP